LYSTISGSLTSCLLSRYLIMVRAVYRPRGITQYAFQSA